MSVGFAKCFIVELDPTDSTNQLTSDPKLSKLYILVQRHGNDPVSISTEQYTLWKAIYCLHSALKSDVKMASVDK